MAKATNEIVIPSSPADLKVINDAIQEINLCMIKIADQRNAIKDIVDELAEKFKMPKKYFNKMARTYFKNSFDVETAAQEDFVTLYLAVTSAP